jgi:hypothetical protein
LLTIDLFFLRPFSQHKTGGGLLAAARLRAALSAAAPHRGNK